MEDKDKVKKPEPKQATNEIPESIANPKKQTGSYTNTHGSGMKYHGKGGEDRAAALAKRVNKDYEDPL